MAYEQLTSPNGVERLSTVVGPLVPFSGDHTMMMWYQGTGARANPASLPTIFFIGDNPQTLYADYTWVGLSGTNASDISIDAAGTSILWAGGFPDAKRLINNHITYVREGTAQRLYVNAQLVAEGTKDQSAFPTPTHQYLGTDSFDADWEAHQGAYFREWNKALTREQIELERDSFTTVELDGLFSDVPFQVNFNDIRGIAVPTGALVFQGHKLGGITVPTRALALTGLAPSIDTYISVPAAALGLVGKNPGVDIGP